MHNQVKIALATAQPRPEVNVDHDMPLLQEAVAADAEVVVAAWDDPAVNWANFDLVVIRSTWDYSWRTQEFLSWVDRCGDLTQLANSPSVIRWNTHKSYLRMLAEQAVPVVHTQYVRPGDPISLPMDHEYVIKPAVGAGARFAARYKPADRDDAYAHVLRMHDDRLTAMVQPYLHQIDTTGERALVFVQGRFLHAIRKNAVLAPGLRFDQRREAHPGLQKWSPTPAELAVARRALNAVPHSDELLYSRVDLVSGMDGEPLVTELELVEPTLYLRINPESIPTVARKIVQRAVISRQDRKVLRKV